MHPLILPNTRTLALPTRWGEVTLGQAARLAELPDGADVYSFLSVVLNLSPFEVMNLPAVFVNEQVLPVLSFTTDDMPGFSGHELPATITLPGTGDEQPRTLPVLPSLDIITFGQATDLGALLQDATLPVSEKRIRALAIVLYPAYHGSDEYDADAKDAFGEHVCSQAILEEALPVTDFFFADYDRIRRGHAAQLKRIPVTSDEHAAGLETLVAEWDALAVVNALASGDKTRWPYFFGLSWGEVNTMIEFENHHAHYRYQLHKRQERKQK